jgi:hypothetical protein
MTPDTKLEFNGVKQPISEWALDYGIMPVVIIGRIRRGWNVEDAITTPMTLPYHGYRLTPA